ncbi:MAG: hypothetical protein AB1540_05105 [Bdellovibrionota bacterium]
MGLSRILMSVCFLAIASLQGHAFAPGEIVSRSTEAPPHILPIGLGLDGGIYYYRASRWFSDFEVAKDNVVTYDALMELLRGLPTNATMQAYYICSGSSHYEKNEKLIIDSVLLCVRISDKKIVYERPELRRRDLHLKAVLEVAEEWP